MSRVVKGQEFLRRGQIQNSNGFLDFATLDANLWQDMGDLSLLPRKFVLAEFSNWLVSWINS